MRGRSHVVSFCQCALEACNLAAQCLDFRLRLERRCRLPAKLVQLETQLGKPVVALLELAAQLVVGICCGSGSPAAVPPEAFSVSINASRSLSSRRSAVKRS